MGVTARLSGKTASRGTAAGKPVIVQSEADLDRVEKGDILVASQTDIAYVPAMHRAAAIITEAGGRFCHAAVWARENNKPTILQVKDATVLLQGRATVTVCADEGYVEWEESDG